MHEMYQPHLEGSLTRIRPLCEEDWTALQAAASDPDIWANHFEPDRYKPQIFRHFFDGAMKGNALVVEDKETQAIVGSSRYYDFDPGKSEIKIGYTFLTRPCWGGLYNTEIKYLMLDHIFDHVDVVAFDVAQSNHRSASAMRRLGANQRDGEFTKLWNGRAHPYFVFEITREAFRG